MRGGADAGSLQGLAGQTDAAVREVHLDAIHQAQMIQHAGQAKVSDPDGAILRDQDIGRLEVAMASQAPAVGVLHPVAALDSPAQALGQIGWVVQ